MIFLGFSRCPTYKFCEKSPKNDDRLLQSSTLHNFYQPTSGVLYFEPFLHFNNLVTVNNLSSWWSPLAAAIYMKFFAKKRFFKKTFRFKIWYRCQTLTCRDVVHKTLHAASKIVTRAVQILLARITCQQKDHVKKSSLNHRETDGAMNKPVSSFPWGKINDFMNITYRSSRNHEKIRCRPRFAAHQRTVQDEQKAKSGKFCT